MSSEKSIFDEILNLYNAEPISPQKEEKKEPETAENEEFQFGGTGQSETQQRKEALELVSFKTTLVDMERCHLTSKNNKLVDGKLNGQIGIEFKGEVSSED